MSVNCSKCGHENRANAKFCGGCGAQVSTSQAASIGRQAKKVAAKATAVAGPAINKAGEVITPVAKDAASKGWAGSKRGMSFAARIVTGGGRAAYSEAFSPLPITSGRVIASPTASTVSAPIELAAILFTLSLLAVWPLLALSNVASGIAIGVIFIVLLIASFQGIRHPYFTRITFAGLLARLRKRGQVPEVPIYKFRIAEGTTGQPLDVVMVGERQGKLGSQGELVELWGIRDRGRNELRAWKVETVDPTGQPVGSLTAPRLFPLTVALFLPTTLLFVVWLIRLFIG